jgi:hypothetical protein
MALDFPSWSERKLDGGIGRRNWTEKLYSYGFYPYGIKKPAFFFEYKAQ